MDFRFFIETIKSGLAFGFMQIIATGSVKELSLRLKSIFKGQYLSEKDYSKIAEIMKESYEKEKTEEYFINYLENNDKLKEILESKEFGISVYQKTEGDHSPNVHGNNNTISYEVDTEKK